jgi:hypothetical protein
MAKANYFFLKELSFSQVVAFLFNGYVAKNVVKINK